MAGIDHQSEEECAQWLEGPQQQIDGDEFHGARKDGQTHQNGKDGRKAGGAHENAIGDPQKEKARENGERMGKGS